MWCGGHPYFSNFVSVEDAQAMIKTNTLKIYNYQASSDEGCLVTIQTPKALYAFEMCGFGKDIEEVKKEIAKNYGNSQIRTYSRGSVLIGREVFTP